MDIFQNKLGRWTLGLILCVAACAAPARAQQNSCLDCHGSLDPPLKVTAEQFAADIHAQKGLNCASCHGGDPTVADMDAMSKKAGFRGKPDRRQIPEFCGRCHSDAAYMRQYNPSLRTDQLAQYKTSVHGQRLAHGDTKVAVCIDCHSVHGIRPASDTRSTVNPLNVAETCSHCHSNAEYMKQYKIPTNQFAEYSKSVHHEAMVVRGDLSAPTCTTCHGNHGAAPPGVDSVKNVCATCHVFQAQMFDKSTHKVAFEKAGLPGCVVCHSNHDVKHPSDAMLGAGPAAVCLRCHAPGDHCDQARVAILADLTRLNDAIKEADAKLAVAESSGMEVSEPRLNQDQARDDLTKARVTIHSFQIKLVDEDIQAGLKVSTADLQAGKDALRERDYRRVGLAISVFAILIVLFGLRAYIRLIERDSNTSGKTS